MYWSLLACENPLLKCLKFKGWGNFICANVKIYPLSVVHAIKSRVGLRWHFKKHAPQKVAKISNFQYIYIAPVQ